MTPEGEIIQKTLRGLDAHIFQHEMDHLNGVLFIDKVMQQKGKFYKVTGKDSAGSDIFQEVTI
jgi:peptide deformylase